MVSKSKHEMGMRIESLREYHSMTREELAEKAGISAKFLYEVERGKKGIAAETLLKIAQVLSTSCDYLLKGEGKIEEKKQHSSNVLNLFNKKQLKKAEEILQLIHEMCNDDV